MWFNENVINIKTLNAIYLKQCTKRRHNNRSRIRFEYPFFPHSIRRHQSGMNRIDFLSFFGMFFFLLYNCTWFFFCFLCVMMPLFIIRGRNFDSKTETGKKFKRREIAWKCDSSKMLYSFFLSTNDSNACLPEHSRSFSFEDAVASMHTIFRPLSLVTTDYLLFPFISVCKNFLPIVETFQTM